MEKPAEYWRELNQIRGRVYPAFGFVRPKEIQFTDMVAISNGDLFYARCIAAFEAHYLSQERIAIEEKEARAK